MPFKSHHPWQITITFFCKIEDTFQYTLHVSVIMPPSVLKYKAANGAPLDPTPILWKDVLKAGGSGCSPSSPVVSTFIKRQMPSDRIVSSSSGDSWNCGAPPTNTSMVMNPTTNNTTVTHFNGAMCVPISSSSSSSSNSAVASSSSSRYKSELCRNYSTDGSKICKFGANCIYAHGESELR